jgi:D-alanyl-D-alanine carboxypeptidase
MNNNEPISKGLLALNGALVLAVVLLIFIIGSALEKPITNEIKSKKQAESAVKTHAFDNVSLQAKSVVVYDMTLKKIVFSKNADTQLPLASLTKLMMALVASDSLPKTTKITVRQEFLQEDGDNGLAPGESWKLSDLLDFSLVVSSNDGARSIASVIGAETGSGNFEIGRKEFISKMNKRAQALGLEQTYFVNESGLDLDSVSGGYGSASNVATLLSYIIKSKPDLLEATKYPIIKTSSNSKNHTARNTDTIIDEIPGLIASKTGYTSLAGGNLAVAFDAGLQRSMVIVVLGSTQEGRFQDVSSLVKASLEYVRE